MRRRSSLLGGLWVLLSASPLVAGCSNDAEDCELTRECLDGTGGAGASGTGGGGTGATSTGGAGGGGTGAQGGGGASCDDHADCTEPGAAKCDGGECVPCDDSAQCTGADAELCEAGTCVECSLANESACVLNETCDLLANVCVPVEEGTVQTCEACTNDKQCATGHRCIAMDFGGNPHGHYCLVEFPPSCPDPFLVPLNGRSSISDAPAADYCGINEEVATCEAVLALLGGWHCTGMDGMCSELMGGTEVAVPGALCRTLGGVAINRCTYECGIALQCPNAAPANTCGDGGGGMPDFCGG